MGAAGRRGVIQPRQKRSEETLARILKGALSLLAERELDDIAVDDIARAAGVSVGAIYRRFESKEDLVVELLRRIQVQQVETFETELAAPRWEGVGLEARLDWLAERQRKAVRKAPGLVRAIFASVINRGADANEETVRLNAAATERIALWLLSAQTRTVDDDVCAAASIIVAQFIIGLNMAHLYPAAFAPHAAGKSVRILKQGTLAALQAL